MRGHVRTASVWTRRRNRTHLVASLRPVLLRQRLWVDLLPPRHPTLLLHAVEPCKELLLDDGCLNRGVEGRREFRLARVLLALLGWWLRARGGNRVVRRGQEGVVARRVRAFDEGSGVEYGGNERGAGVRSVWRRQRCTRNSSRLLLRRHFATRERGKVKRRRTRRIRVST